MPLGWAATKQTLEEVRRSFERFADAAQDAFGSARRALRDAGGLDPLPEGGLGPFEVALPPQERREVSITDFLLRLDLEKLPPQALRRGQVAEQKEDERVDQHRQHEHGEQRPPIAQRLA